MQDIGVVTGPTIQIVIAAIAFVQDIIPVHTAQDVLVGVTDDAIVQFVAGTVGYAGDIQVFNKSPQRIGDRRNNPVVTTVIDPDRGKLEHLVIDVIDIIGVVAGISGHPVAAGATVQHVVIGATLDRVIAEPAAQDVIAAAANNRIGAVIAVQIIVAGIAVQRVIARRAVDTIVAVTGKDQVADRRADDRIVAGACRQIFEIDEGFERVIGHAGLQVDRIVNRDRSNIQHINAGPTVQGFGD